MKTSCVVFALLASTLTGALAQVAGTTATANQTALPAPTDYSVVANDKNSRVWERTEYEQAADGTVVAKQHRYTELSTGLNYQDPQTGRWQPSQEEIDILPNGGAATHGAHQVYFPGDIAQGVIRMVTPDGLQLQSRPVGLFFNDDSNTVMIAILTNSVGQLVSSNQVVYPNAFEGASASVRYTYSKSGFEQDIVVQGQLPDPAALGLDPAHTRLGVLTAFFDTNNPVETPGPVDEADGLSDSTLTFGSMTMGRGRAFAIGDTEPSKPPAGATPAAFLNWMTNSVHQTTPTYKRWFHLDGVNFLMEEVPYWRVAAPLSQLPPMTGRLNSVGTNLYAANSFLEAIPGRLLSPAAQLSKSKMMRLARTDGDQLHGFVLDYVAVNSGGNYLFQGDTTYYVSGLCDFNNVTFEGGTVIKYENVNNVDPTDIGGDNYANAFIEVDGTLTCNTSGYRPAVFTAVDDDTVGETISGSTGNPVGNQFANPAIYTPGSVSLSNVRINYAQTAVWVGDSSSITLADSQVNDSQTLGVLGVNASDHMSLTCNNCLYNGSDDGILVLDNGVGGNNYNFTNCTFNNIGLLAYAYNVNYYANYCNAVNCIFANSYLNNSDSLTSQGSYNGFYNSGTFGSPATTAGSSPFQTVGAGSFYLATNTFRGIGTASIGSGLLADIKTKTTWPPLVYSNVTISTNITLSPQAPRDTNASPDLGYHYDPIDYLTDKVTVTNATVTVIGGTAIATYNEPGIQLQNGSALVSTGTPLVPNWFVRYQSVQDNSINLGGTNVAAGQTISAAGNPSAQFQFSKFAAPANGGSHLNDATASAYTNLLVQNCEFWVGQNNFTGSTNTTATVQNNLFFRSVITAAATNLTSILSLTNNLFFGGTVNLLQPTNSVWAAWDNDFDSCTLTNSTLTNGYNAYLHASGRLYPTNQYDIVQTNTLAYQTSWLGSFYQPTNSPLINMGSTTAGQLGLAFFTTQTNQMMESNTVVDIGYHYVALNTNGLPFADTNGIPYYLQNGFDPDGSGLPIWWELLYFGYTGIDPNADPDGDGLSNLQEYQDGTNPTVDDSTVPGSRLNYIYDAGGWLQTVSGVHSGSVSPDSEGNIQTVSQ